MPHNFKERNDIDMTSTRTSRILVAFHCFYYCEEVSMRALTNNNTVSRKTALRDVRLLKDAGLIQGVKYCRKYDSFIPTDSDSHRFVRDFSPKWPEGRAQKLYMEKIIRLCTLMTEMVMCEVENPIEWYRKRYPELSERTRQRDFIELKKIDYNFSYEPEDEDGPAGYYYDYPH